MAVIQPPFLPRRQEPPRITHNYDGSSWFDKIAVPPYGLPNDKNTMMPGDLSQQNMGVVDPYRVDQASFRTGDAMNLNQQHMAPASMPAPSSANQIDPRLLAMILSQGQGGQQQPWGQVGQPNGGMPPGMDPMQGMPPQMAQPPMGQSPMPGQPIPPQAAMMGQRPY